MFNRKKKRIKELEEALECVKKERDFELLDEVRRRESTYCDRIAKADLRIEELEEKNKALNEARDRDFVWGRNVKNLNTELLDKNGALEKKVEALEEELKQAKREHEYWYGQYQIMATKSTDYGFLVDKYLFENMDTNIDDEGVIYNHKVYKITGRKQIVDDYGDTLELKCMLVDPKKEEKREIGFVVKEPVIKDEEDKQ